MKTDAMKSRLITSTGTGPLSHNNETMINNQILTHTHTHFAVTLTRVRVLAERLILLMSFRNKEGALISEGGSEWGVGVEERMAK